MPVKRRCCRQDNKAASIDQYRRYSSYRLEQYTCECKSNRVATEDDEAKDAVDPPLQLVWNQGQFGWPRLNSEYAQQFGIEVPRWPPKLPNPEAAYHCVV